MNFDKPRPEFYKAPLDIFQFNGMPYMQLGKSGLWVSRIGLGTWKFGRPESGDEARVDQETGLRIFDRALELGVTFWDTAPRYNNASGNSERVIGAWFKANPDQRRNIVIATKLYGGMDGLTPNHCRLTRGNIKESVYASLERMQIDTIDLLYFHHYDAYTPVDESLSAVEDLVRADLVRYLGVSNFSVQQLEQHLEWENTFGARCRIIAVQNQFDVLRGEHPDYPGVRKLTQEIGAAFIAYSPLAEGFLTDRYLDLSAVSKGDRIYDQGMLTDLATPANHASLRALAELARKWELSLSQLVLAFTLSLPGMGPVIPGASSFAQLESNAKAGSVTLTPSQIDEIKTILKPDL
jgi:aryl-alcohol dehydrogenase-like predicted oxidoreductase